MIGKNVGPHQMRERFMKLSVICIWGCGEQKKISGSFNLPSWQNVNA